MTPTLMNSMALAKAWKNSSIRAAMYPSVEERPMAMTMSPRLDMVE